MGRMATAVKQCPDMFRFTGRVCQGRAWAKVWQLRLRIYKTHFVPQWLGNVSMYIGQTMVAALELVRQQTVVDTQQMQDRGVKIVDVDRILGDVVAEFVGGTVTCSRSNTTARYPDRKAARMMVTSVVFLGQASLATDSDFNLYHRLNLANGPPLFGPLDLTKDWPQCSAHGKTRLTLIYLLCEFKLWTARTEIRCFSRKTRPWSRCIPELSHRLAV